MNFFVTDLGIAQALAQDAMWKPSALSGYETDGNGCVVRGGAGVSGVIADVSNAEALKRYFALFTGDWFELKTDTGVAQCFVSDAKPALINDHNRAVERLVAQDVARLVDTPTLANSPIQRAGLVMRARSHLRAIKDAAPVGLREGLSATDVTVVQRDLPYAKYFDVEDLTLRHKRFDGTYSDTMVRSVLRSADAVTVLPYDPVLDQVVLVEQFRPAAFVRGDTHPWVLEPVAGRCDGDEPVEVVAEREMIEEAGLELLSLEPIGSYYPSPGCLSEYLYSFVGLVDLSNAQTGVHGLETENEDIRTHFVSFDAAIGLIQSGEADNGPLLLSLYWLMAHRARLREAASAA